MERRQRRPSAYDDDPIRSALHGRARERLPAGLLNPSDSDPTETYGDRALALIDTIVAIASRRIEAAKRSRAAKVRTELLRRTRTEHIDHLINVANVLGAEIGIGTLYDDRARELGTAHHAAAVRAWIDDTIAAGSAPNALRDAIVDTALERGYNPREAAAIASVSMLPGNRRGSALPTALYGKHVPGERSAQRRQKKLLARHKDELRNINARLTEARAGRGMYGKLETGHLRDAIRGLEGERVMCWHLINQLGGVSIARRSRISRSRRA